MIPDIALEQVSFSYGRRPVLSDITFEVPQGEFLVIIGPNGGGKSTLLRLLLGLLHPQKGIVRLFGAPPAHAVSRIGYVPQDVGHRADFPVTALDVALMGRRGLLCSSFEEDLRQAHRALDDVGMDDFSSLSMGDLSHGQRQRVLIARALCSDPSLLLLDEPTASVDVAAQETIYALLKALNRTMTIVLVSHDLSAVTSCATAVACVREHVYYHGKGEIVPEMIERAYGSCPVELVAHGIPHRVLAPHTIPNIPQSFASSLDRQS